MASARGAVGLTPAMLARVEARDAMAGEGGNTPAASLNTTRSDTLAMLGGGPPLKKRL